MVIRLYNNGNEMAHVDNRSMIVFTKGPDLNEFIDSQIGSISQVEDDEGNIIFERGIPDIEQKIQYMVDVLDFEVIHDADGVNKKAFESSSPLAPKEGEKKKKPALTITDALRKAESAIIDEIIRLRSNNTLAEVKASEDVFERLRAMLDQNLSEAKVQEIVESYVKKAYAKGLEGLEMDLDRNFIPNEASIKFLNEYNFDLIKNMTEEVKNNLTSILKRAVLNDKPISEIKKDVQKLFNNSENRAEVIVRTEFNRATNQGRLDAAKQSEILKGKTISVRIDDRTSPICSRMSKKYEGKTIGLDEPFFDDQTGQSFQSPPFHPNCRTALLTKTGDNK